MENREIDSKIGAEVEFLEGPLFREASPPVPYLEVYDAEWRSGAQAVGYRTAAETLIDVIIDQQYATSRTLLHPLLFLYRHSIELRFKRLIEEYGGKRFSKGHELVDLWRTCKTIIAHYLPSEDMSKVERLINELHAVDPNSQAFRYATTPQGKPIEIPFGAVDLVHLRKQMTDLDTFFFGLEAAIEEASRVVD